MVDALFQCQEKAMSNFLEDEWLSPERINNMLDHAPTMSLANSTSTSLVQSSGYLQPRMSPAFSHGVEDLIINVASSGSMNGLGISNATTYPPPRSTNSRVPSPKRAVTNSGGYYDQSTMDRSRLRTAPSPHMMPPAPQTAGVPPKMMHQPISIAPYPLNASSRSIKRSRPDDQSENGRSPHRSRSNGSLQPPQTLTSNRGQTELSEEDQLLLKLKHEENLPWKDIAREFETRLGRIYQVPALQMRHKRLRERMRAWTEDDVSALEAAYEYWEKSKFEIISQKMLEFGAQEKWPAKYCERKWEELHPETSGVSSNTANLGHPGPSGTLQPAAAPATVSHDAWSATEQPTKVEHRQSTPTMSVTSRSPAMFTASALAGSPVQQSPVSSSNEKGF